MRPIEVTLASPHLFAALGRSAAMGRTLEARDNDNSERVVVLSDAAWHRYFDGDPNALGRIVDLNHRPFTIVGVMPPDFRFPTPTSFGWVAVGPEMAPFRNSDARIVSAIARVRPGHSLVEAQRELNGVGAPTRPDSHGADAVAPYLTPLRDYLLRDVLPRARAMGAAAALIFLLACANAAALFAVGMLDRHRELAIRHSLGATRGRLTAMVAQEAIVLAAAGGGIGYGLAYFELLRIGGVGFESAALPAATPHAQVAVAAAAMSALLYVSAAVWQLYRQPPHESLRAGTNVSLSHRGVWWRRLLVSAELAGTLILAVGAALAGQSVLRLSNADLGFDPDSVTTLTLALPYTVMMPPQAADARLFVHRVLAALNDRPGVTAAAIASDMPSKGGAFIDRIGGSSPAAGTSVSIHSVTSGYFRSIRLPVLAGRNFRETDGPGSPPVALVDRELAEKLFGPVSPIGQNARLMAAGLQVEIIGITGTMRHLGAGWDSPPAIYVPYAQLPVPRSIVLVRGTPAAANPAALRRIVGAIDPQQSVPAPVPLARIVREPLGQPTLYLSALTPFAIVALMITVLGLYSISSLALRQRHRELAIRAALGADSRALRRLLAEQTLRLGTGGLAVGIVSAAAFARVLQSVLEGVRATDPLPWVVGIVVVCSAVLLGTAGPAMRAGKSDPARALRADP